MNVPQLKLIYIEWKQVAPKVVKLIKSAFDVGWLSWFNLDCSDK